MRDNATEILCIDKRLQELEGEQKRLLARRRQLLSGSLEPSAEQPVSLLAFSVEEKIRIFQSLFQGRNDVIAARWQSSASGKSGYSPACHNEWRPGVCQKPKVKCTDCPHSNFESYTEKAVHSHLTGKRTLGVYPLRVDETCLFLAVDFDKKSWQEEVSAFVRSCQGHGISCHTEVSRSGNGAHVWIFFSSPVLAKDARQMGSFLLDQAMDACPELSFDSYDRFFPNQDTLPKGRFGNLIALPLQYFPRQQGFSVFVGENFKPLPDQWLYLSKAGKVAPEQIASLIDIYQSQFCHQRAEDLELLPWEAGLPQSPEKIDGCPESLKAVLANGLYISVEQLPARLLARMRKLASFPNPVFFKTQAMRFSTQGIPRIISCSSVESGFLHLPRGCLESVGECLGEQGCKLVVEDKRALGRPLPDIEFIGQLKPEQQKAIDTLIQYEIGVLHAPTAFGKTVAALALIAKRKINTLILVHSRQLVDQWRERALVFLNIPNVGTVTGGKKKPSGLIDIATYQSLVSRSDNRINSIVYEYGQIIIDECHHLSAPRYEMLLSEVRSHYVLGITATPYRQDGHQPIVHMQAGPIRYKAIEKKSEYLRKVTFRDTGVLPLDEWSEQKPHISDIYQWLVNHEQRNRMIVEDVLSALRAARHPVILTERKEHACLLHQALKEEVPIAEILHGGMRDKNRRGVIERIINSQMPIPLVATGRYLGEGFDLPKLDTLFLALPVSWKGTLAQYVGRIHREHQGKGEVVVYDYADSAVPVLSRMKQRREKGYKALGYVMDSENFILPGMNGPRS